MVDYASVFVVSADDHVLVMRRGSTAPVLPYHWDLPGGHIEDDELPDEAAARELFEETRIDCSPGSLLNIGRYSDKQFFILEIDCDFCEIELKLSEHDLYAWCPTSKVRAFLQSRKSLKTVLGGLSLLEAMYE